jgi:putative nucleotidyltransferase with HDIG domain
VGLVFDVKEKQIEQIREAYVGIVEILAKYLESTDRYTKGHSLRVANLATDIAIAMEVPRFQVETIRTAALLHDIGKVELSGNLIRKAAELTTQEKEEVSTHSDKGAEILQSVGSVLKDAIPLVLHHHNFYQSENRTGSEASGEHIPLGARIIAVADSYDAIVTDRPYRKGRPPWQAFQEIKESTPHQFDPAVVEGLRIVMSAIREEEKEVGA